MCPPESQKRHGWTYRAPMELIKLLFVRSATTGQYSLVRLGYHNVSQIFHNNFGQTGSGLWALALVFLFVNIFLYSYQSVWCILLSSKSHQSQFMKETFVDSRQITISTKVMVYSSVFFYCPNFELLKGCSSLKIV